MTALSATASPLVGRLGTFSPALALTPGIRGLLGADELVSAPRPSRAEALSAIVSWAGDENEAFSQAFAKQAGLPWFRVAPGFVYRVGVRGHAEPPLSLTFDQPELGRGAQSSLLSALSSPKELTEAERERARELMARIVRGGISTWNNVLPGSDAVAAANKGPAVLVALDNAQEPGCFPRQQVRLETYEALLAEAKREHPDARVWLKLSEAAPRELADWARKQTRDAQVVLICGRVHAFELLSRVEHVYVVHAHLGFEALVANKPVSCFGTPWYAGWGLTLDRAGQAPRARKRQLADLFFAAYVEHARYADPETGEPWQLEDALAFVERQLAYFEQNRGTIYCHGFTFWKRTFVRAYLRSPGNRIVFAKTARHRAWRSFDEKSKLLVWGTKEEPEVAALAARYGVPLWRMEDGFLRSVGLGADLTVPASLVIDREGIYFDPNVPSSLETILQTESFEPGELVRARALRESIVAAAISKYNVGNKERRLARPATQQRVILVPGQVEDDASIQRGCRDVRTNEALLAAVRAANPDAYILFKPHPDVTDARRVGAVADEVARKYADEILLGVPLPACLAIADEVHTLTSLVGFEALLRGLKVATYGLPFYAGWGLTQDRHMLERRTRRLTLDELVAGVLIRYPRYLGAHTRLFVTPETVAHQLQQQLKLAPKVLSGGRVRRELRRARHVAIGVLDVP